MKLGTPTEIEVWFRVRQLEAALRNFNDSYTDGRCRAALKQAREDFTAACRAHMASTILQRSPAKKRKTATVL